MWYNINFDKLAIMLLPTFLRKPIFVTYVQCLFKPIADIHYEWLQKRTKVDFYALRHTGQVCRLRKVLNDRLDNTLRRIRIGEGTAFPQEYIWTESEQDAQWLDDTFFVYTENEYENTGVDFTVFVPLQIKNERIYELKYLLKYYKLAGKRYKIEVI